MPDYFLVVKFQAHVSFWLHNIKLRRTPLSRLLRIPPGKDGLRYADHLTFNKCRKYTFILIIQCLGETSIVSIVANASRKLV